MTENLWGAAKAVLRGKFIAIRFYLKKQETSQINNLTLHLNQIESHLHKARRVHLGECDPQEVMTELGPEMEELTRE